MTISLSADALIKKAQECYSLGLIDEARLETVTSRALTEPGFSAILELPFDHEIERERGLRRQAARHSRLQRLLRRA